MRGALALLLTLTLLQAGCAGTPQSGETGTAAVVSLFGVETVPGGLRLLAAAEGRGDQAPLRWTGQGETPAQAVEDLTGRGKRAAGCAHVEHLLLSPNALSALPALVSYAFQEPRQSTETQLWVVRTDSLDAAFSGEEDVAQEMAVLKARGKDRQGFCPLTLREAAGALAQGKALLIPALFPGEEGMTFSGYALCRGGTLLRWFTGEEALGAALLLGDRIHWTASAGEKAAVLESGGCLVTPAFQGERLTGLTLTCPLEAVQTGGWESTAGEERALEALTARAMAKAFTALQEAGADGAALLPRAGLSAPLRWTGLSDQWEAAFPTLAAAYTVQINWNK